MAEVFFENPPILGGSTEDKLVQLYRHLFDMSNKLNEALMSVSIEQMAPESRQMIQKVAETQENNKTNFTQLKSMIIKTAEIVRTEMDEIRVALNSQYTAISEQFGTYQQTINTQIEATAAGILQDYHIEERIQGVEQGTAEFEQRINAYIFSGILDEFNNVGIAIGYNVTNPDGTLNQYNKMATFTADRLTFYVNGSEAAYFSNQVFHIAKGEVTVSMRMGNYIWQIMSNGAMGLMKA